MVDAVRGVPGHRGRAADRWRRRPQRSTRSSRTFQSPTPPGRDDRHGPSARAREAFESAACPRESCRCRDAAGRRIRPVRFLTRLSPTSSRWPNGSPMTSRMSRQGELPDVLWRSSSWRPGQLWPPRRNVSSLRLGSRCRHLRGRRCCRPFPWLADSGSVLSRIPRSSGSRRRWGRRPICKDRGSEAQAGHFRGPHGMRCPSERSPGRPTGTLPVTHGQVRNRLRL